MDLKAEPVLHLEDAESNSDATRVGKSLKRKWDTRMLPVMFIIYFCSFMDRANVGNASIAGLNYDLHLVGDTYSIALGLFFVMYTIVDVPAVWVFPLVGRGRFLAICITCWGAVSFGTGFINTIHQFYAIRCLLGLFEGCLTACLFLYIGYFYTRYELQKRIAWFYISGPISNAVGGLLASGLGKIHIGYYSRWRWIFIVEGAFTILVGIGCFFVLPNWPTEARYLSEEERALAHTRAMAVSNQHGSDGEIGQTFTWKRVLRGILDQNSILPALASLGIYANVYAYTLFSPNIIKAFGFSTLDSQLLSVPPYVVAALYILVTCYASDRLRMRAPFVLVSTAIQTVGWIIQLASSSIGARYFGLFLVAIGSFGSIPPSSAIVLNNIQPQLTQGTAFAFVVGSGTCGGILTSFTYISTDNKAIGNGVQVGLSGLTIGCFGLLMVLNKRENARRARGERDYRLTNGNTPINELGSRHPDFQLSL